MLTQCLLKQMYSNIVKTIWIYQNTLFSDFAVDNKELSIILI